jgi:hypothetical protein
LNNASTPISSADLRARAIGEVSFAFLLDQVATGIGDIKPRDALLVLAINQANIAPLTRRPEARRLYGALEAPAPDHQRRPVSISAVASSLGLPFETVRRRVKHLEDLGVCIVGPNGVIVPESFLGSPGYMAAISAGHAHLLAFYRRLRLEDLLDDLPGANYAVADGVPMRAAARLISDYVLRTAEQLMRLAGDLMGALVVLGLLGADAEGRRRGSTVVTLSRRLQLPQETVRRHAVVLIEQGQCVRTHGGLAVSAESLERPGWLTFFRDNASNVQRLFAALAERGVVDAWRLAGAVN